MSKMTPEQIAEIREALVGIEVALQTGTEGRHVKGEIERLALRILPMTLDALERARTLLREIADIPGWCKEFYARIDAELEGKP